MAPRPDDRPVVGFFEDDESGADRAAREIRAGGIRAGGIRAGVTSGTEVADGRFGGHLRRGLVIGVVVALPFAIVLPLIGWARSSAGVSPFFAVAMLSLPILFLGAFLALRIQTARYEISTRARAKLVVTEPALDSPATDQATTIIDESGGEVVQAPKPGRSGIAD